MADQPILLHSFIEDTVKVSREIKDRGLTKSRLPKGTPDNEAYW